MYSFRLYLLYFISRAGLAGFNVCLSVCVLGAGLLQCLFQFLYVVQSKAHKSKKIPKHQTLFLFVLLALVASLAAGLPHPSKNKTFENDIHTTDVMFSYRTRIRYSIQVHIHDCVCVE